MRSAPPFLYSPAIVEFDEHPAILRCAGDEDRSTQGSRRAALTRAIGSGSDVIVDLSDLVFADSSLMLDLAMLSRRLRRRGRALRVRAAQPQIRTLITLVGLHNLPGVELEDVSPALT